MIMYRLELENFYSFRERQILDLTVPGNVPVDEERFAPLFKGSNVRAPKVVAVFGANGSGKSNLLKAIPFFHAFVVLSFKRTHPGLPFAKFNDEESASRPTRLAIELGGAMELAKPAGPQEAGESEPAFGTWRYELEIANIRGMPPNVLREALLQKPNGIGKWRRVFERSADGKLKGSALFSMTGYSGAAKLVRPNASVVSTLAQFNHPGALAIQAGVSRVHSNIFIDLVKPDDDDVFAHFAGRPERVARLNKQMQMIDVGVESVELRSTASGPTLNFSHAGHGRKMSWEMESNGTRNFIRMLPWLTDALAVGGLAVLDEIDASIHPGLLPEIIGWFHRQDGPQFAQLWMSCHAVSLLEDLAKEEIVFCEKDRMGRSKAYSLRDVKPARRNENFYRKYMGGEYGAVPRIG